ncbi:MAG: hypothetical protein RMJ56_06490 [Gemmataceae bacterium]|nr:hypothetical protein [Gemmata sp.]MDW8197238.1 hypothetical protein [Gemmataceae bacterium]
MSRAYREQEEVYAVLRHDGFHGSDAGPEVSVIVKEIVRSRELAEAEVNRLNAQAPEGVRYWWQVTRLFSHGYSAEMTEAEPAAAADPASVRDFGSSRVVLKGLVCRGRAGELGQ